MKSHLMENMSRAYLPTAGAIGDKQPKRSRAPLTVCQISMWTAVDAWLHQDSSKPTTPKNKPKFASSSKTPGKLI